MSAPRPMDLPVQLRMRHSFYLLYGSTRSISSIKRNSIWRLVFLVEATKVHPVVALNSGLEFIKPLTIEAQPLIYVIHWITQIVTFEKYNQSSGNRLFMVVCSWFNHTFMQQQGSFNKILPGRLNICKPLSWGIFWEISEKLQKSL